MSSPNLINITSTVLQTATGTPGTANTAFTAFTYYSGTSITGMTLATSLNVVKVDSIIATNISTSAITASVAMANASTFTLGWYVAYQVTVPPNASVILVDKTTPLYITDSQSLAVYSSSANNLVFTLPFEILTASS
jgi:hypothetical protein